MSIVQVAALIALLNPDGSTAAPAPTPTDPAATPNPTPVAAPASTEPVLTESCDGSRAKTPAGASDAPACQRWKIEWVDGGKTWGLVTAPTRQEVIARKERHLGFVRQYARYFDAAVDPRYGQPSDPICDTCQHNTPSGRYGAGQKFGGGQARDAVARGRDKLLELSTMVEQHLAYLKDAARLSREKRTANVAKRYAMALRDASVVVASSELELDNAADFRSKSAAERVEKELETKSTALQSTLDGLLDAVAREVRTAHGGRYNEESANLDVPPYLDVKFDGSKVTAVYVNSGALSTWFEGEVKLDGSVAGRSLVAPEGGGLTCNEHAVKCGFIYVPAFLRFSQKSTEKKPKQVAELWFRQSNWVQAKPFSR